MPLRVNTRWSKGTRDVLTFVLNNPTSIAHTATTTSTTTTVAASKHKEIATCSATKIIGDIVWVVSTEDIDAVAPNLKRSQYLSRIPGLSELCKKATTCAIFQPYVEADPERFSFFPRTWILPTDFDDLMLTLDDAKKRTGPTVIFKPSDGSQGDGIYLLQGKRDVVRKIQMMGERGNNNPAIVQKYIRQPMLHNGYKFDLRLYVVLLDVASRETYLCREGLVRFCTMPYDAPTARNLHHTAMHLTNYSLSKMSRDFVHDATGETGTKRLLSKFWPQLMLGGEDVPSSCDELWENIRSLVSNTMTVLCSSLASMATPPPCRAFHIIGFDVLFDRYGKAHLLELNNNPSMQIDETHALVGKDDVPPPGKKVCKCMSHYRPHYHDVSAVDLACKSKVVQGVLSMVECKKKGDGDVEALAEQLDFEPIEVSP
eukprot:PhM_4_TR10508/c0_g1_i1/m.101397/K16604/TTLL11; tubulin polyglutamylase TTLL11